MAHHNDGFSSLNAKEETFFFVYVGAVHVWDSNELK